MGIYLNPGNEGFRTTRNGTYVDKSGMISLLNDRIGRKDKLVCVSRPRRFGKSTAAQMVSAYYDCGCDSSELFDDLEIAKAPSYREHLNKYYVIYVDITGVMDRAEIPREKTVESIVEFINNDISREFPDINIEKTLAMTLWNVASAKRRKFVMIIDEWDALNRDPRVPEDMRWIYLQFLRSLFKNSQITDKVFAAAYMTGILPIKKDGTQSAISEFNEFDMIHPRAFQEYVGFQEEEVEALCSREGMDFAEMKSWYDGYSFERVKSIYNPNSVMKAIQNRSFESYWSESSSAGSLLSYIDMDFDGLSEVVWDLMRGKEVAELKRDDASEAAIGQIRSRNYPDALKGFDSEILLVGITYDAKEKKHWCRIEAVGE